MVWMGRVSARLRPRLGLVRRVGLRQGAVIGAGVRMSLDEMSLGSRLGPDAGSGGWEPLILIHLDYLTNFDVFPVLILESTTLLIYPLNSLIIFKIVICSLRK